MYKMYLDDIREPAKSNDYVIIRTAEAAIEYIQNYGMPTYISFDHDLGEDIMSGYDFAKWLVEESLNGHLIFPKKFSFNVHSANPVGAANIEAILENYLKFKDT
jgi:hypothetical protein